MRSTFAIGTLLAVSALAVVTAQGKSTQDGVYTDAQATRGEAVYTRACVSCHQADLSGGGQAAALVGPDFNADWKDQTLGDLFDRTKISMPADNPGSLSPEDAADVIAFLLSKAKFPAGQTEVPTAPDALKAIKFVAPNP
jgi:mono/diheme cytochrome c family protein